MCCAGRWDTAEHSVFGHRDTLFVGDWCNKSADGSERGPREGWHDIHCRLEGPACRDVMRNFEERWRRQVRLSLASRLHPAPTCLPAECTRKRWRQH
jgi:phospholipase D1/2